MREIKFRTWDREQQKLLAWYLIKYKLTEMLDSPEYYIVEQYTGLKDKNGIEIFEGDILKYDDNSVYSVVHCNEQYEENTNELYMSAFMLKCKAGYYRLICNIMRPYRFAEIIGNIHENKELLTKI